MDITSPVGTSILSLLKKFAKEASEKLEIEEMLDFNVEAKQKYQIFVKKYHNIVEVQTTDSEFFVRSTECYKVLQSATKAKKCY